eukprot:jgi/Mesvir1/10900/Mv08609-RA.1
MQIYGRAELFSRVVAKLINQASLMDPTSFMLMATGQLEYADIPDADNAYCKYVMVHGDDWHVLDGVEDGITQITRRSSGPDASLVWNFPIDITYKSTNAFGWPQLVLSVFQVDALGRDVIKGYGAVHLPTAAGRFLSKVRLYRPLSASLFQQFMSWWPVLCSYTVRWLHDACTVRWLSDPCTMPAVTRVKSTGTAYVQFNIVTKDMATFGYSEDAGPAGQSHDGKKSFAADAMNRNNALSRDTNIRSRNRSANRLFVMYIYACMPCKLGLPT